MYSKMVVEVWLYEFYRNNIMECHSSYKGSTCTCIAMLVYEETQSEQSSLNLPCRSEVKVLSLQLHYRKAGNIGGN